MIGPIVCAFDVLPGLAVVNVYRKARFIARLVVPDVNVYNTPTSGEPMKLNESCVAARSAIC